MAGPMKNYFKLWLIIILEDCSNGILSNPKNFRRFEYSKYIVSYNLQRLVEKLDFLAVYDIKWRYFK